MLTQTPFYKLCLEQELARRCDKNARYSLRAFAKALEIDPGNLSRFMAGKAFLSSAALQKLLDKIQLNPEERILFIDSLVQHQSKTKLGHAHPQVSLGEGRMRPIPNLELELFRVIGDWYHCAILELTFVDNFKYDPKWIASQLGISSLEASLAVERLLNLELLQKKGAKLFKTDNLITTKDKHITTPALKKLQRQILEKAIVALENVPIEERNQASMTMAIDPKKIPLAKKMIEDFTSQLCVALSTGKSKKVYQFTTSLYPLQKKDDQ